MASQPRLVNPWLLLPVFWLVAIATYGPALSGAVLWDDIGHLTSPSLRGLHGLWRIWFEVGATQQYYPVVHSAFWVLDRLWGGNTAGYHVVNVSLHAVSACLIVVILRRLGIPGAVLAGTIFLLHPLQVESVAWMTELKNTLSTVCYLAAFVAYLRYDERRRGRAYVAALAFFMLAVFSKTVTASLPAALLVVFWWRRGRVEWAKDVKPLVPFFVIAVAGGLVTVWVEHTFIGARGASYDVGPVERVLLAGRIVWFYLSKLLLPIDLAFMYPRWQVSAAVWWQYLYPVGLVAGLLWLWRWRVKSRAALSAALLFIGSLVPALGFVNVYPFRYSFVADHFQYLAGIAIIAAVAAGLVTMLGRRIPHHGYREAALVLVVALPLGAMSWQLSHQYVSNRTLFLATLERNPTCWMCHQNLGAMETDAGNGVAALAHFEAALRLNASDAGLHHDVAIANARFGHTEVALREYQRAIALDPARVAARQDYGEVLLRLGRVDDAADQFREAVRLAPGSATAHAELGLALLGQSRINAAIEEFRESLRLDPTAANVQALLALALSRRGS